MSGEYSKPIVRLAEAFRKLPGVGPRSARRMAWHVVEAPYENAVELARALVHVKKSIRPCPVCFNYTDQEPCAVCSDEKRDRGFICVVETADDVAALERAGGHAGVYHVLGGTVNPAAGKGAESVRAAELVSRVEKGGVSEVLIATNPSVEGEATAMYLTRLLRPLGVRLTRPARGIPGGADMDYLDDDTLAQALRSRQVIEGAEPQPGEAATKG